MASTYSTALRLELMGTGDQSGTWGDTTNTNLGTLLEQSITGVLSVAQGDVADLTLSANNGASDQARNVVVNLTGALTAARNVVVPTANKVYLIKNSTTGGFAITVKTAAGTGVTVPATTARWVYCDGTNVVDGISGPLAPSSNDAQALGLSGTAWSDLFLASGGVLNWNAGDVTITHSADTLAFAGAASGYTFDDDLLLIGDKTFSIVDEVGTGIQFGTTAPAPDGVALRIANVDALLIRSGEAKFTAHPVPATSDGYALGSTSNMWSDLFLASGGVINFASGDVTIEHATTHVKVTSTDAGATVGPVLAIRRNSASPAANDVLGRLGFHGQDSTGTEEAYAYLQATLLDPTNGSEDGDLYVVTKAAGVNGVRAVFGQGLYHPNATGGDKGNNTINFGAVYDDNTLLTCYVFDAALDGQIEDAKWDAKVPDRQIPAVKDDAGNVVQEASTEVRTHQDMRKFRARLGSQYDPLDIDKYTQHWKDKRHLSSLPNETNFDPASGMPTGDWIQRLVETVEIQAVHLATLNDRLKAAESKLAGL